ncbi:MAG: NYN domain-containing protein [Pseudomonadota bacterium]
MRIFYCALHKIISGPDRFWQERSSIEAMALASAPSVGQALRDWIWAEMIRNRKTPAFAVLIDADNASARHADAIFEEVATFGEAMIRRIYGNFADDRLQSWDKAVQAHAILQQQQRNNTTGKNASDIALVIDAMDLLYKGTLNGVCIVSSDSDFTRLAQRLREEGLTVIGIGEKKAPEAFRNACNRFIYVENIGSTVPGEAEAETKKEAPSKATPLVHRAMNALDDEDGWVKLGALGSKLHELAPDFDTRSFGHAKLSALVKATSAFDMKRDASTHYLVRAKARQKTTNKAKKA